MKYFRMMSRGSNKEKKQKTPRLEKKLKSLLIQDESELQRLHRDLASLMEMGNHLYSSNNQAHNSSTATLNGNPQDSGLKTEIKMADRLSESKDQHKFYKKRDVLEMIQMTKSHIDKMNTNLKHSVQQYKNGLETFRGVLAEQGEMVGDLAEEGRDTKRTVRRVCERLREDSEWLSKLVSTEGGLEGLVAEMKKSLQEEENSQNGSPSEKRIYGNRVTSQKENVKQEKTKTDDKSGPEETEENKLELLKQYNAKYEDGLTKNLKKDEVARMVLMVENRLMDLFFEEIKRQHSKQSTCRHCKEHFSEDENNMKACFKHEGQLRYEPCLKCKKSELFTCCGYCQACSFGCTPFQHVSIL